MITNLRRHRRICAMLLLILLPACHRWQLAAISPIRQEDVPPDGHVLITLQRDGSRIELQRVSVSSDTLAGVPEYHDGIQDRQQLALADISRLEIAKMKVAGTERPTGRVELAHERRGSFSSTSYTRINGL